MREGFATATKRLTDVNVASFEKNVECYATDLSLAMLKCLLALSNVLDVVVDLWKVDVEVVDVTTSTSSGFCDSVGDGRAKLPGRYC